MPRAGRAERPAWEVDSVDSSDDEERHEAEPESDREPSLVGGTTDESDGEHGEESGSEAEPEINPIQEHINMLLEKVYLRKLTAQDFFLHCDVLVAQGRG